MTIPQRIARIAKEAGTTSRICIYVCTVCTVLYVCMYAGVKSFIHISALSASPDSTSEWSRSKFRGEQAVREAFPEAVRTIDTSYIHTYIHTPLIKVYMLYIHSYIHTYIHTYILYMYIHTYCICTYILYICIHTYILYIYIHMCRYRYIHHIVYTYKHKYTQYIQHLYVKFLIVFSTVNNFATIWHRHHNIYAHIYTNIHQIIVKPATVFGPEDRFLNWIAEW